MNEFNLIYIILKNVKDTKIVKRTLSNMWFDKVVQKKAPKKHFSLQKFDHEQHTYSHRKLNKT